MLEIYGREGSIQRPNPNDFTGDVLLWTLKTKEWQKVPLTNDNDAGRGLGAAEMAQAIQERRPHRASGLLALTRGRNHGILHVSARNGKKIALKSICRAPEAMPEGLRSSGAK